MKNIKILTEDISDLRLKLDDKNQALAKYATSGMDENLLYNDTLSKNYRVKN